MATISPARVRLEFRHRRPSDGPGLDHVAALSLAISVCIVGLVFYVRRLQGGSLRPLSPGLVSIVALAIIVISVTLRGYVIWRQRTGLGSLSPSVVLLWLAPLFFATTIGMSVALPGSDWGVIVPWGALIAALEGALWWIAQRTLETASANAPASPVPTIRAAESDVERELELPEEPFVFPPGVTQQLTRFHTAEGQDIITAALRAEFAAGQRQLQLHVAFCPPFATIPEFSVHQVGGPESVLKAGQVLHHGARIEVRRGGDAQDAADVLVEMTAIGAWVENGHSAEQQDDLSR